MKHFAMGNCVKPARGAGEPQNLNGLAVCSLSGPGANLCDPERSRESKENPEVQSRLGKRERLAHIKTGQCNKPSTIEMDHLSWPIFARSYLPPKAMPPGPFLTDLLPAETHPGKPVSPIYSSKVGGMPSRTSPSHPSAYIILAGFRAWPCGACA